MKAKIKTNISLCEKNMSPKLMDSTFVSRGAIGHEGGDLLLRGILKNINEMFEL